MYKEKKLSHNASAVGILADGMACLGGLRQDYRFDTIETLLKTSTFLKIMFLFESVSCEANRKFRS